MKPAFAQSLQLPDIGNSPVTLVGPLGASTRFQDLASVIGALIPYILSFAGLALLLMILFGGFGLLTSAGDPKKLAASQQRITMALVGFIIIFIAFWVVQILGRMLGFDEILEVFP